MRIERSTSCSPRRRSTWPRTGRSGRSAQLGAPGAGGEHDLAGLHGCQVGDALVAHGDPLAQRGDERARVDGAVAGDVEREPDRRRQRALAAARLARAQALAAEAERPAEGVQAVERLGVVAVARDDHRPGRAQLDAEVVAEGGVAVGALQAEAQQRRPRRTRPR